MNGSFKVSWTKGVFKFSLALNYFKGNDELTFDLENNIDRHNCTCANISVFEAKQIRDRLNDFIKEVEAHPQSTVNPSEPK